MKQESKKWKIPDSTGSYFDIEIIDTPEDNLITIRQGTDIVIFSYAELPELSTIINQIKPHPNESTK